MPAATETTLDLLQELQLRTWARENYASPEMRQTDWHPIVLEEMQLRDDEVKNGRVRPVSSTDLVPLAEPIGIPQPEEIDLFEVEERTHAAPIPTPHISIGGRIRDSRRMKLPAEAR